MFSEIYFYSYVSFLTFVVLNFDLFVIFVKIVLTNDFNLFCT